jgi:hypothetical protein
MLGNLNYSTTATAATCKDRVRLFEKVASGVIGLWLSDAKLPAILPYPYGHTLDI